MIIFSNIRVGYSWEVESERLLTPWEYLQVVSATVVESQFGYSVQFILKNGVKSLIPLSDKMDVYLGMVIDPSYIRILTLHKPGEGEIKIYRVEF